MPSEIIEKPFVVGLRTDARSARGNQALVQSLGIKPSEFGGIPATPFVNPVTGLDSTPSWPFPQYFQGEEVFVGIDENGLYSINSSNAATSIPIYEMGPSGSEVLSEPSFATVLDWDFTDAFWAPSAGTAVKIAGAGDLVQLGSDMASSTLDGKLYRLSITVTSVQAEGEITISRGSYTGSARAVVSGVMEFDLLSGGAAADLTIAGDATSAFVISDISLKIIVSATAPGVSSTSKPFHFIDFRKVWFLTNGTITFFCSPANGSVGATGFSWRVIKIPAATMKFGSMCRAGNRLYISGFDYANSHFSDPVWEQAWDTWIQFKQIEITHEGYTIGKNTTFYSKLSGGDYWWPFAVELAMFGVPDAGQFADAAPFFLDHIKKGELGFFKWPFEGECLRTEQLGQYVIGYGTNGIGAASVNEGDGQLMHTTKLISRLGLGDKGAVCVSDGMHVFQDVNGRFWSIDRELNVVKIDRAEFALSMITNKATNPISCVYDSEESDFEFSNGLVGYVISKSGVGETTRYLSAMTETGSGIIAYPHADAPSDGKFRFITDAFDFKERFQKTIHDLEIGYYDITNFEIRLHYSNELGTEWDMSDWVLVVEGGFNIHVVSGYNFRIEGRFTPGTNFRLEYVKVNWRPLDHRNFRIHQRRR